MSEKIKDIQKKLIEYWNKWTPKQKTIIISIIAAVIVVIALIVYLLGRTHYTELYTFEDTTVASQAITTLKESNIVSKLASDKKTVLVDENSYVDAVAKVYSANIGNDSFSVDDLFATSLTTTNGERLLRNFLYSESKIEAAIMGIDGITSVSVNFIPKDTNNSVLIKDNSIPAAVTIGYNSRFNKKHVEGIASIVAKGLGNDTTDMITVVDVSSGEILFNGSETTEADEDIDFTTKLQMEKQLKKEYKDYVTSALIMNGFTEVDVSTSLTLNWDKVTQMFEEYLPLEGEDRGVLYEYHETSSSGTSESGNVPGTDTNNENDYMLATNSGGTNESSSMDGYYKPTYRVTNTVYDTGTITDASIFVTARKTKTYTKSELETLGLIDEETTYEKYRLEHREPVQTETPVELIEAISLATGIDKNKVKLITYDYNIFVDDQKKEIDWTMVGQIALAVGLLAILMLVIIRGLKPVEITEVEPELSIEQLLATTKENQSLEDVEFSEESETRRMIEKFFDENPEAVASLLRNWLNEDWM